MVKNEIGNTYGKLVVIERAASHTDKAAWLCQCVCGTAKVVSGDSLRQRKIVSCGCFQAESRRTANATHRMTKTPTYRSWQEMKVRCTDPSSISYANYGSRGITFCKRWLKFENFFADMGVRPKGASLDRKNNDRNYCPSNCRWSTRKEQNRNKRSNVSIMYRKETRCLSEWCEVLNLPYPRMYHRIVVNNWVPKIAFETPNLRERKLA